MEADHREPAARLEQALGGGQPGLELVELAVDVDADRLEAARRRVLGRTDAVAERLAHDLRELAGGRERARSDDRAGDAAALPLLAVLEQHVGDRGLGRFVEEVGGGRAGLAHRHVERPVDREREPAPGLVELHRGDADVHRHAVDAGDARFGERGDHLGEAARVEHQPRRVGLRLRPGAPGGDRVGIAVERVHGRAGVEDRAGVAAGAEGRVDDHVARLRRERCEHLAEEDGDVGPLALSS